MRLKWLNSARIMAIFFVIMVHTAANVVNNSPIGSEYWWVGNIFDSSSRWCVPVFIMISGALLLNPDKEEDITVFYKKRLSKIAIPLIFWSVFFTIYSIIIGNLTHKPLSKIDFFYNTINGTPYYHLWFIYMLIFLYVFTPFFRKIIKLSNKYELFLICMFSVLIAIFYDIYTSVIDNGTKLFIIAFLQYIPYYFLGYFIRVDEKMYSSLVQKIVFIITILITIFGYYLLAVSRTHYDKTYFYHYMSITCCVMSVYLFYIFKNMRFKLLSEDKIEKISSLTFGVYLIHPVFLEGLNNSGFGTLGYYPLFSIPITAILVFSASLFASWVISKIPVLKRII